MDTAIAVTMIPEYPAPTHKIIIGARAVLGKLFSTTRYGSKTFEMKLDHQRSIAIKIPKTVPAIKPTTVSITDIPTCLNRDPVVTYLTKSFQISEG